jgi:hypothetical protein
MATFLILNQGKYMEKRGPNGNLMHGGKHHPVKCSNEEMTRWFPSIRQAGLWLVEQKKAKTLNSAMVAITHSVNGKQHYYGRDWNCNSAYGFVWENI